MFQQFPQKDFHKPVVLHKGRFRVRWDDRCAQGEGLVRFNWLPSPGIEIEINTTAQRIDPDSVTLDLPGFRTDNLVVHSYRVVSLPTDGAMRRLRASVSKMDSGCEQDFASVGFQVVNFTNFFTSDLSPTPGDPSVITSVGEVLLNSDASLPSSTRGAATLSHDGWMVNLVEVSDADEIYKTLAATGGWAFTHVGLLKRKDDAKFDVHSAETILDSVTAFLSFARGAACDLPIRWGRCAAGNVVWRHFRSPEVDRWGQPNSWFDRKHGELLPELFDAFCRMHNNEKLQDPLQLVLHWYRHSNTQSSGLEGSVILGMAALDLLSAIIITEQNRSMSAEEHDNLSVACKLRALLKAINVPVCIPSCFKNLVVFASKIGTCEALAELRNGFVHAKEKRRKVVFSADGQAATFDAWQLLMWYQELALLYLLGHQGGYVNRTTQKYVGQLEQVPWALRSVSVPQRREAP